MEFTWEEKLLVLRQHSLRVYNLETYSVYRIPTVIKRVIILLASTLIRNQLGGELSKPKTYVRNSNLRDDGYLNSRECTSALYLSVYFLQMKNAGWTPSEHTDESLENEDHAKLHCPK
jgi:hypothetical protein